MAPVPRLLAIALPVPAVLLIREITPAELKYHPPLVSLRTYCG
jgi:hypothetical protein